MTTHRPAPEAAAAAYADAELEQLREHLARTAHDLSNALCAVVNYAAFLEQDLAAAAVPPAIRDYLPQLQRAAQRAVDLVNRLGAEPPSPPAT
jgi:signal transduction histidine kinase